MADADATAVLGAAAIEGDNGSTGQEQNQQTSPEAPAAGAWVTDLPDDHQKMVEAKKWAKPEDVVRSYADLERYSSKTVQDMTPEERTRFYKRIGRPDSVDEYELSNVTLPKGIERTSEDEADFKTLMLDIGATKEQAKQIHEHAQTKVVSVVAAARKAVETQAEKDAKDMRETWTTEFDANWAKVQTVVRNYGDEDAIALLNSGVGKKPPMMRMLLAIANTMTEDTLEGRGPVPPGGSQAESGGFDWSGVPEVSGDNRYGHR
mgnify:CR=1 FL=1